MFKVVNMRFVHLNDDALDLSGLSVRKGAGIGKKFPYSIVNFGVELKVQRIGVNRDRYWKLISCNFHLPAYSIKKEITGIPLEIKEEEEFGMARQNIVSLPLNFIEPKQAVLRAEFMDGSLHLCSMDAPLFFNHCKKGD